MPTPIDYDRKNQSRRLVELANTVTLDVIFRDFLNEEIPWGDFRSHKLHCPVGFEHRDGGVDRAMRIYPSTNSAFCFAMHHYLNPVKVVSLTHDDSTVRAALRICRRYDLIKPQDYKSRYYELAAQRSVVKPVDPATLVEALHVSLSRHPRYDVLQYDPLVISAFDRQLELLDTVDLTDASAVRAWFTSSAIPGIGNALIQADLEHHE
jgi:hypothetical protein